MGTSDVGTNRTNEATTIRGSSSRRRVTRQALVLGAATATLIGTGLPVLASPASASPADTVLPVAATAVSAESANSRIAKRLAKRIDDPRLGNDVTMRVYDAGTGKVVFKHRSAQGQRPASNTKVVTAFAALKEYGPSHRFTTRVVEGKKKRSVVLVGGGDPLLSSKDLRILARRTKASLAAEGRSPQRLRVFIDDSLFARPSSAPGWKRSYYSGNIEPVRALGRFGVYVNDSGRDAAQVFARALQKNGVRASVQGRVSAKAHRADGELASVARHELRDAVRALLIPSNNRVGEVLFRQVAVSQGRTAGWKGSTRAVRTVLRRAGVPLKRVVLKDGSGLSRRNRLTNAAMIEIFRQVTDGQHPRVEAIIPGLPVAGRTGTLWSRYRSAPTSCAAGRVFAKTGTLNDTNALSGFTRGADGELKIFSVLVNSTPYRYSMNQTRFAVDRLVATLTGCY